MKYFKKLAEVFGPILLLKIYFENLNIHKNRKDSIMNAHVPGSVIIIILLHLFHPFFFSCLLKYFETSPNVVLFYLDIHYYALLKNGLKKS